MDAVNCQQNPKRDPQLSVKKPKKMKITARVEIFLAAVMVRIDPRDLTTPSPSELLVCYGHASDAVCPPKSAGPGVSLGSWRVVGGPGANLLTRTPDRGRKLPTNGRKSINLEAFLTGPTIGEDCQPPKLNTVSVLLCVHYRMTGPIANGLEVIQKRFPKIFPTACVCKKGTRRSHIV
jgi:hypothetical protein